MTTSDLSAPSSSVKLLSNYAIPVLGLGVALSLDDNCRKACVAALKNGYRHIDTAEYYKNEIEVGRAVRESGIPREDIFITTKIFQNDFGYESTQRHVADSLRKFDFSYIDLYLIHSPRSDKQARLDTYRALLSERDAGRIRSVGVSNYGIKHVEEIREAGLELPSVNQIELHPLCQQREIAPFCKSLGIVVEAYAPLIRGGFNNPTIQTIAQEMNKEPAQILIRWSLQHNFVPLPKSENPARICSNADVFDFTLTDSQMEMLDALDRGGDGAVTWNPVNAE